MKPLAMIVAVAWLIVFVGAVAAAPPVCKEPVAVNHEWFFLGALFVAVFASMWLAAVAIIGQPAPDRETQP